MKFIVNAVCIGAVVAYFLGWLASRSFAKSEREWREKELDVERAGRGKDLDVERAKRELDERLERWSREK